MTIHCMIFGINRILNRIILERVHEFTDAICEKFEISSMAMLVVQTILFEPQWPYIYYYWIKYWFNLNIIIFDKENYSPKLVLFALFDEMITNICLNHISFSYDTTENIPKLTSLARKVKKELFRLPERRQYACFACV